MDKHPNTAPNRPFTISRKIWLGAAVSELPGQYAGPEGRRVKQTILALSQGDLFRLRHYLDRAMTDYRDVLRRMAYPGD